MSRLDHRILVASPIEHGAALPQPDVMPAAICRARGGLAARRHEVRWTRAQNGGGAASATSTAATAKASASPVAIA